MVLVSFSSWAEALELSTDRSAIMKRIIIGTKLRKTVPFIGIMFHVDNCRWVQTRSYAEYLLLHKLFLDGS